jgi:hypothetical protein
VLVTVDGLGYDKRGTASHRGIGLATGAASARRATNGNAD